MGIEERAKSLMAELYEPLIVIMSELCSWICEGEMTKYVANAMLATKISFANEMANFERLGADSKEVHVRLLVQIHELVTISSIQVVVMKLVLSKGSKALEHSAHQVVTILK